MRQCLILITVVCASFFLGGCILRIEEQPKLRDLEYTIIEKEQIPQEMVAQLKQLKEKPFQFIYSDQGKTYLAEEYGVCPTTGYSIEVNELYETENAVHFQTSLMGPSAGEETKEITTFPYIVVEIQGTEKEVVFD